MYINLSVDNIYYFTTPWKYNEIPTFDMSFSVNTVAAVIFNINFDWLMYDENFEVAFRKL